MKKVLILAVIAILLMMPVASFAKTTISDNELDEVTAQQGVTLGFTNVTLNNLSFTSISWGDSDGYGSGGWANAGYAGLTSATITGDVAVMSGEMKLDVGTNAGATAMQIVLPTVAIGGSAGLDINATVTLASNAALTTSASTLGVLTINDLKASLNGTITVAAH